METRSTSRMWTPCSTWVRNLRPWSPLEPKSNIVCFRYRPGAGDPDQINQKIAEKLLADGSYYVVSTTVGGDFYLRVTLMNPFTDRQDLEDLLEKIKAFAQAE